ncbi:MAG: hypothetical protein IJ315_06410 [Firmicutes bacterium]|nr:hypothetical protein [Bacillota bacterium]
MDHKEEKWLESHLQDLARQADRYGTPMYSDFLDTAGQDLLFSIQKHLGVEVALDGGYEGAERRMASFCPPFLHEEDLFYPLCCLEIQLQGAKFLKKKPQHRDYLGAILGSGLDRRKIGDVLVQPEGALVFICEEMEGYLKDNLREVGSATVEVVRFEGDMGMIGGDGKELVISVASLRLDAVLSRGFGAGRSDAADWIKAGRVQVDHRPCNKADQAVHEGAILSVRGKGRLKLKEITGTSKSGRIQIKTERFG